MTTPSHHPELDLLLEYAGGGLSESLALLVATHLAFCPNCRRKVREMEMMGGVLLEDIAPEPVAADALDALFARLDEPDAARPIRLRPPPKSADRRLPEPLRGYIANGGTGLRWKPLLPGLSTAEIPVGAADPLGHPRLLKMSGHARVPRHTHDGLEFALVVEGGFHDDTGAFGPGDLVIGDASIQHTPVADPEGCLCLSLTVGSLKMTGPIGRLLQRLGKFA
jgi:putative transcriptional regulator